MFEKDSTIYVSELPANYSEKEATDFFGSCGKIEKILLKNYHSSEGKYAFVCYEKKDMARKAFETLNYSLIGDKNIFIQYAYKVIREKRYNSEDSIIIRDLPETETDRTVFDKYKEYGQIIFCHINTYDRKTCYIQYMNDSGVKKSGGEVYKYSPLTETFTQVKVEGIQEQDEEGILKLLKELGEMDVCNKQQDGAYFIKYKTHEAANAAISFLHLCVVGSSVIKVHISEKDTNQYRYCLNELVTHMADESDFTNVALKNLPTTVTCGQDVREICEKYGKVRAPRLNLNENWGSLGSAMCMMMTHEDALKLIEGLSKDGSSIIASRSMTSEEAKLNKESMDADVILAQRNSSKDRQFLIRGYNEEDTAAVKKSFSVARQITKVGTLVLVIFKDTKQLDQAVSSYSGQYGDLLFFNKDANISAVPLGKTFPPQQRFPFRNNIIERLKVKVTMMDVNLPPEKYKDVTPDVARFLIAHEKVLQAWINE